MLVAIIFLTLVLALDFAAVAWGADSADGFLSREWERRRLWRGPSGG